MKKHRTSQVLISCLAALTAAAALVSSAVARDIGRESKRFTNTAAMREPVSAESRASLHVAAAANTTYLATYNFNSGASCVNQGWVSHDLTVQIGDFVHVDDFAGLGGGSFGLLSPIQGAKSLWIGARPNTGDPNLCSYASLPGYGNGWQQILCSKCFTLTGDATLSFDARWDSEPGYDFTNLEIDAGCASNWSALATANSPYTGQGSGSESVTVTAAQHGGSARIRFNFVSDTAWSDADGLWDTDGAFIVDNLKIVDNAGTQTNQTFEAEALNAHGSADGHWSSCNLSGYGDFAGLLPGAALLQEDPCSRDLSCVWAFIVGSTANYACGGFPGVVAVPFGNADGQYLNNEIVSPQIAWTGSGNEALLQFDVYRDQELDNLVFYTWGVRSIVGGCPGPWRDEGYVYYGDEKDWLASSFSIGGLISPGATAIQISLGVSDLCSVYCGTVGSGACHSHTPLFDNVRVKRIELDGPQWTGSSLRVFQDNFATDGTVTGTVRVDAANDILPVTNLGILPGDSAAITVVDPVNGLGIDPSVGGAAVYAYVKVSPTQVSKTGAPISGGPRWPVVGTTVGSDGDTWTIVRFDTCYTQANTAVSPNNFCVDLNDNLFVPGDTVQYFFAAESQNGARSYYFNQLQQFDNGDATGAVNSSLNIDVAYANAMEMTCLPAAALNRGGDILYVDDSDGRSVQPYFDQAFKFLGIYDKVDRYDVNAPSSTLSNGPGGRVTNIAQQILPYYKKIIWSSGDLADGTTLGDGTGQPDKADDCGLVLAFLDQSTLDPGLYLNGDGVPGDLVASPAPSAVSLRSTYLNYNMVTADHKTLGLGVAPKGIGTVGGIFNHVSGPDTMVVYGGCSVGITTFDVTQPTGTAVSQMNFAGNPLYGASISQTTLNGSGHTARVLLEGFSYDLIRDDRAGANGGVMDRVHHLYDVITWLQNTVDQPTGAPTTSYKTTLSQNYPNPFNPSTTIEFTVRNRSQVTLKIYNVAGQLVRTLVNDERVPGAVNRVAWDGRNDAGQSVSSGVYFYKLVTSDMTQTRKMVLLK